jgi:hypothetical protein
MKDQFDPSGSVGEIANGVGVEATMHGIGGAATVRTHTDLAGSHKSEADGIVRSVLAFMDNLEAVKIQLPCPQIQAAQFLHDLLLFLAINPAC